MKKILLYSLLTIFTLALAIIISFGVLYTELKAGWSNSEFMVKNGCWYVNPQMDLEKNAYQRAVIAVGGLFALREQEVLYYTAKEDDQGRPLHSDYQYEIVGTAPAARYWSFTMYGSDHFLVPNEVDRFGFNLETIEYDFMPLDMKANQIKIKNSHFRIIIDKDKQVNNWLPASKTPDNFVINLRLYNPTPEIYNNLTTCTLPIIRRIDKK